MGSDVAAVAFLVASALMFFPYFSSLFSLLGLRVIPELLNETSHRFPKRVNKLVAFAQTFGNRAREMSRERSRGQPGTIEIGSVEPREWNAPGSHDGFACEHSGGIREGFQSGIEIGVEPARNSVQRQEGFAQEEKFGGTGWPCRPVAARSRTRRAMDRQCPEAAESG